MKQSSNYRGHKSIAYGIALSLLAAGGALVPPFAIAKVIDTGITLSRINDLFFWLTIAIGAALFAAGMQYIAQIATLHFATQSEENARFALFKKILHAELLPTRDFSQGEMLGHCLTAAEGKKLWFLARVQAATQSIISLIGIGAILLYFSWQLTLSILVPLPFAGMLLLFLRRKLRKNAAVSFSARDALYRGLHEAFRSLDAIQASRIAPLCIERFMPINQNAAQKEWQYQKSVQLQIFALDVLQALMLLALFGIGAMLIIHDQGLTVGLLVAFQLYMSKIFGAMRSLSALLSAQQHYAEARERENRLMGLPEATDHSTMAMGKHLKVINATFAHGERLLFDNLSFELKSGENLAVLAPSGSGKTTLAYCLMGLYPLQSGHIEAPQTDGAPFAIVPQQADLFTQSLRDNILLGAQDLDEAAWNTLFDCCQLHDIVKYKGLDGPVGEGGQALSGGEKKRVLLARALAQNPRVLLIDQITSDVDPHTCKAIFSAIRAHYPKLSIVYLGHRAPEGLQLHQTLPSSIFHP